MLTAMKRHLLLAVALLSGISQLHASPAAAKLIEDSWNLANERWQLQLNAATSPEERAKLLEGRPLASNYTSRMWQAISPSLAQEWTLPYLAWLVPSFVPDPANAKQAELIFDTLEQTHLRSAKLIPVCIALTSVKHPRVLPLLEKIAKQNPDPKIQGVAALAASIQLKQLGDKAEIIRRRLAFLRTAIVNSSEVELTPGTTVAMVAEDELYTIRFLTKGRTAPKIEGTDSGGRPMKLSDYTGKVVILVFWKSTMPEAHKTIEITAETVQKFRGKPVVVLGVNQDTTEELRKLQADEIVTWPTFSDPTGTIAKDYRAASFPYCYVLNNKGAIEYAGPPGSFAEFTAEGLVTPPAAK